VDLNRLPLLARSGTHTQKVTFIAALLDAQGNLVAGREGVLELALKEATLARLKQEGVNVRIGLDAPPGTYRLRFVAETAGGKLTATTQEVEAR